MEPILDPSAIIAAFAAVAAVVSAGAAWRQANEAKRASEQVLNSEKRNTLLSVVQAAKKCEVATSDIRRLAIKLNTAFRLSEARRGVRQDGLSEVLAKLGQTYVTKSEELCQGLPNYLPPKVDALLDSPDLLHAALVKLTGMQTDLQRMVDDLNAELERLQ